MLHVTTALSGAIVLLLCCLTAASAVTLPELCATLGHYSDTVAKSRDSGISVDDVMVRLEQEDPEKPSNKEAIAMLRKIVLYVYTYPTLDATSIRQRIETSCLGAVPKR